MLSRLTRGATLAAMITILLNSPGRAAGANVEGVIKDATTGDLLPGANVVIEGTSLGAATDISGKYLIRGVPSGQYTIRATYVGYKTASRPLVVAQESASLKQDFNLEAVTLEGEQVVVTAQALGQNQAINQQLAATQITNVVSSARIQELPDANAAESVGRLPGVSILRSGGEGNQVIIRGLQPKYNAITIEGVRMASSSVGDRSTDLSMISPYMLEGIEVSKSVTADQDADVLGGTVNFKVREAGAGNVERQGIGYSLLAQGGYTGLSNASHKLNNYKYVGSADGRFFDSRFGVFVQADLERRNLTSNEFGASYTPLKTTSTDYYTSALTLYDVPRDRQRANGTVVLDYRLPEGKISLINFFSSGKTEAKNRSEVFTIGGNQHSYNYAYSQSKLGMVTNTLNFDHQIPIFHMDAKISHSLSETKNPGDWSVGFMQSAVGDLAKFANKANLIPTDIPKSVTTDLSRTTLINASNTNSFTRERAVTASLDLDAPLNLSESITSVIKFGGKYRYQTRSYTFEQYNNNANFGSQSARIAAQMIASRFPSAAAYDPSALPMTLFLDRENSRGDFLNGDYANIAPLDYGMVSAIAQVLRDNAAYISSAQPEGYARNNLASRTNTYDGHEELSAFYAMATINIGPQLSFIPGVRYQNLKTTYTGVRGIQGSLSYYTYNSYDTTVTQSHGYWLPDVILRYKPLTWLDVRLSYTNTIAYPDYNAIIPRIDVAQSSVSWNNYQLVPSRSKNYDAYVSVYNNDIGLFTVGGFLKQIDDLVYGWTFYVSGAKALAYYPPSITAPGIPPGNPSITTYKNNPYRVNNWGIELDWQTHFWYLPSPLNGLVLNANYTHIFSKAQYPFTYIYQPVPGRPGTFIDTSFTDRLLYQPNDIVNLSLGYDYRGFSVRVSMLYQANVFTGPDFWPQVRANTSPYRRWDLSVKQDLPFPGLQLYGDVNNINGANDISVIQGGAGVPISEQSYGTTADLGIRWQF